MLFRSEDIDFLVACQDQCITMRLIRLPNEEKEKPALRFSFTLTDV